MKLKNRILVGYSIPIAISTLVTGTIIWNVNAAQEQFKEVEKLTKIEVKTQETAYHLAQIEKASLDYVIVKNAEAKDKYNKMVEKFDAEIVELEELVTDAEQKELFLAIDAQGHKVIDYTTNLMNLVDRGQADQAQQIWNTGDGRAMEAELEKLLEEATALEIELLGESEAKEKQILTTLFWISLLGSLLASGISVGLAFFLAETISKTINQSITKLTTSSSQIATTTAEQERSMTEQATSVNETTTTIEELGATSRQTAEQAMSSTSGAQQAIDLTEKGNQAVAQTMSGINELQDQVGAIADQIMRLSEQTGQIGMVSDLVADVANQTNMLALNAAVEAARAGEQGKGFTVVADEIRKLADQSKKSADQINNLVGDIQASINSTVMVTDQGQKTAIQGLKLAEETTSSFNAIAESVNNVFLNSQQITMSAKQQAVAVQQVVSAMNAINLGSQETVSGISQIKAATGDLNKTAEHLKATV
ncbi:MAG: methyl-accepting chemotaxis protein [Cyanobacteria bacterium P01_F01_bin.143]